MRELKAWLLALGKVLVKPTRRTFEELARDSKDKLAGSIVCLIAGILISGLLDVIKNAAFFGIRSDAYIMLFAIIFIPIALLVYIFCVYAILRKMHALSQTHYGAVLYIFSLLLFDYFVISSLIAFKSGISTYIQISLVIGLYVLFGIALHAINRVKWWKTAIALIVCSVILLIALTFGTTLFAQLLNVGNVFMGRIF